MKVAITGAGGFVGGTLVQLLASGARIGGQAPDRVLLLDRVPLDAPAPHFECAAGELQSDAVQRRIADFAPTVVFHLASMPGGAAEADYRAGRAANLDATLRFFETLAQMPRAAASAPPRVVFASTIAVYGSALPARVDATTPLHPPLTYGAHKRIGEILLADFSRRGELDGRSLRLPGIVARPRAPSGLASAFISELLHALAAGEAFTCPVSPQATAWWMSVRRCADNLLHAAAMTVPATDAGRAWPMPVLHLSIDEVVETLARCYGDDRRALVRYAPQPALEAVFGRYPPLDDGPSRALGLRDDESADALVRRALGEDAR